ncbi:MAG: hypothetical protein ACLQA5_06875 [Solirubrobacteraceae bacterium]
MGRGDRHLHPARGEEVAAADGLKPDVDGTTEELRDFVKRQVAAYISERALAPRRTPQKARPAKPSSARSRFPPVLQAD